MRFSKAHAYGNDFLYVRQSDAGDPAGWESLAREMCERHTGVGADGLIIYDVSVMSDASDAREGDAPGASMRLFNADGTRAEVSGNGVRALAALLLRDDPRPAVAVTVRTDAGAKRVTRMSQAGTRQLFSADMGRPSGVAQTSILAAGESVAAVVLNMGNPQCVILGALPDAARFARLGAALEHHERFPEGTNIEFVHLEAPDRLRILIWERGCGPTSSSGTGSCASLVAAAAHGGAARDAEVIAPGGSQRVEWRENGDVYLTGWAEVICDGDWLLQNPRTR